MDTLTSRPIIPMVRAVLVVGGVIVLSLSLAGCFNRKSPAADDELLIAATFFPLYDFTRAIVGDEGRVVSVIPRGIDPHSYEPSASDLQLLQEADVLVTLGTASAAEWEGAAGTVPVTAQKIEAAAGIPLVTHDHAGEHEEHGEDEKHGKHEHEEHGGDIHVWLSIKNAIQMTQTIGIELIAQDSERAAQYETNMRSYLAQLSQLREEMSEWLSDCEHGVIISTHDAYRYLAAEYGFEALSIYGADLEGGEPSSDHLVALIERARREGIAYLFYEPLIDRRIPEIIAAEIGATLLPLHPLEYAISDEEDYLSLMRENGRNLARALACS